MTNSTGGTDIPRRDEPEDGEPQLPPPPPGFDAAPPAAPAASEPPAPALAPAPPAVPLAAYRTGRAAPFGTLPTSATGPTTSPAAWPYAASPTGGTGPRAWQANWPFAAFPPGGPLPPLPPMVTLPRSPRRAQRAVLVVTAVVVVVVWIVVASVVVGGSGGGSDATERLAAVQAQVAEATSYRITITDQRHETEGDEENGTDTTSRSTAESSWDGDTWHAILETDDGATESIVEGEEYYEHQAERAADLDDELWVVSEDRVLTDEAVVGATSLDDLDPILDVPGGEDFEDEQAVATAVRLHLGYSGDPSGIVGGLEGLGSSPELFGGLAVPTQVLEAIDQIEDPVVQGRRDDVTTLAGTLAISEDLVEEYGDPLPPADVELDVGADDLPTALRLRVEQGGAWARIEVRFVEWNGSMTLAAPPESQVDRTPWLDEEGLRGLENLALVWLAPPPEGWQLTVWSPFEAADIAVTPSDCETVGLDYDAVPPDFDEDFGYDYLWLTLRPAACATDEDPTPFAPGGPGGWPSRLSPDGLLEVQVGDTAVAIETSLPDAERDAMLAGLAPVDVETLIEAASEAPDGP